VRQSGMCARLLFSTMYGSTWKATWFVVGTERVGLHDKQA